MERKNYSTKQREFLMTFFIENPQGCYTIEEINNYALEQGITIGQTTIYRNLEKLVEEKKIIKHLALSNNTAYFQYLDENRCQCRSHLFCTDCKSIIHLDCDHLNQLIKHVQDHHQFLLNQHKTVIYGLCQNCQGKEKSLDCKTISCCNHDETEKGTLND